MIHAESFDDADILGKPEDFAQTVIEHGTIGWDGETESYFDLGTEENGGVTFVQVQLFRGRDGSEPHKPDRAQGHKIMARLNGHGGFWVVPKRGSQCFVAFPGGYSESPGVGVIIATPGANPSVQFSGERAVMDFGPDADVVIKGRRISIQTYSGSFIALTDEAGIQMIDKDGDGVNIHGGEFLAFGGGTEAQSVLHLTADEANLMHKGGSFISFKGANSTWMGTQLSLTGTSLALGVAASPATPVLLGMTGLTGLPSTCIYGTP